MSPAECRCGRPVHGTVLCWRCRHTVSVALTNIPAYALDAEISAARSKAVRYDLPRGKGGTKSMPGPVDPRFMRGGPGDQALLAARGAVVRWCRVILAEHRGWDGPGQDTLAAACAWLRDNLSVIAAAGWAEDCKRELLDAERALYRVDAQGPERVYAGLCTVCLVAFEKTPLYALPGEEWVTCPASDCGMEYRVKERRDLMLDALEFEWMTASKIADLATYLQLIGDREWVRTQIKNWQRRGTIRPASTDESGRPVFPFGEVSRLLMTADSRRRSMLKGA